MIDFKNYKKQKLKKEKEAAKNKADSERRDALLEEMAEVDTELLETPIPESDEKVNYELIEARRNAEFEKFVNIAGKINDEARSVLAKWEKEGFDPFED